MRLPSVSKNIGLLIALSIIEVSMVGYIAFWREGFWNAVSTRNLHVFTIYLVMFTVAALVACVVSGYATYLIQYTGLILRRKLTRKAIKIDTVGIENASQRIQQDCLDYPTLLLGLSIGLAKTAAMAMIYSYIIVTQLGYLYLLIPVLYSILGTAIAGKLASPLIGLNYLNQVVEASFRGKLTKMNYALVHRNNHNLFRTTKFLAYFQSFYGQIGVIVPYIILAPVYFSGKIVFGVLMQVAASLGEIIASLSYFITSFNDINRLLSCRKRLKELGVLN